MTEKLLYKMYSIIPFVFKMKRYVKCLYLYRNLEDYTIYYDVKKKVNKINPTQSS